MKLFDVYPLFDIEPVKAQGSYLWDRSGERYLDFYGGHAVISIGHSHPHYVSKISDQLQQIGFYSNSVQIPLQHELAEKLSAMSGYPDYKLFLCNSGAEANENALKLASFHTGRKKIIAFTKSFHGRTSLAVEVTDDASLSAPVNSNGHVIFLPFNDEAALEKHLTEEVAAVIIEGIQGVGGVQVPANSFLQKMEYLCNKTGALLILDEIQSGCGRTGKFFAHQYAGVKPHFITMAKGMGNGFPVAGVLIHPDIQARHGLLGTTFGGNHLACAAAIAVLDVMEEEKLLQNATTMGKYLMDKLKGMPGVKEVRGTGLLIGVELNGNATEKRKQLLTEHHVFTGYSSGQNTIRLLPALNLTKTEADMFLHAFETVLQTSKDIVL